MATNQFQQNISVKLADDLKQIINKFFILNFFVNLTIFF